MLRMFTNRIRLQTRNENDTPQIKGVILVIRTGEIYKCGTVPKVFKKCTCIISNEAKSIQEIANIIEGRGDFHIIMIKGL